MKPIKTAIKICGLQSPELAYSAAKAGANYVGIMFHPSSSRHVSIKEASAIADAAQQGGAEAVAVCVNQSADDIIKICNTLNINTVQLHGDRPRREHLSLPAAIKKIYVLPIDSSGKTINHESIDLSTLDKSKDFLLFDGPQGGSGQTINLCCIPSIAGDFNYFIAGGLNADNVSAVITQCKPYAVDVSSGVENNSGIKQENLIQQFISAVHTPQDHPHE